MPVLNGLDALIELKNNPSANRIPVIMITGIMTSSQNLKTAIEAGAIDFLRKPFDRIEILARVKSILELQEKYRIIEENNLFIHSLMESITHPLVYYNLEGVILGFNRQFEDCVQTHDENIKDLQIYQLWKKAGNMIHQIKDRELIQTKKIISYESKCGLNDREMIFSKSLYYNSAYEPEGILCIMTDITEIKQMHNEIIDSKKRELAASALRLIHISEMNNSLINELVGISNLTDKKGHDLINNLIKKFSINYGENIWQEFEMRFENVYESFYQTLNQLFPDLSPSEKKLCALLKLNLSSKEIAALTFQNSQSIDMARYRLRKKLKLNPNDNLIDFLMNLS